MRPRGLDPIADRVGMRWVIEDVVSDYGKRTLTSSLPALPDRRSAARAAYDTAGGLGRLQATRRWCVEAT